MADDVAYDDAAAVAYDDAAAVAYDDAAAGNYDDAAAVNNYDDGYYNDYEFIEDDEYYRVCKVYSAEDPFTSFVQVFLAMMALFSLYVKRQNETPRRKFMTWWLDVSKQGLGAAYAHVLNMLIANVIAHHVRGDYVLEDQCAWYAINFFVDTTLGLFFSVILLQLLLKKAKENNWVTLKNCGVYEGPDGMTHWWHQLIAWLGILSVVKVILILFLLLFSPILARIGGIVFRPLQGNIQFELLFVMIILPGVLNFFYFWIADGYLKADEENDEAFESCCEDIFTRCTDLCIGDDREAIIENKKEEQTGSNYIAFNGEDAQKGENNGDASRWDGTEKPEKGVTNQAMDRDKDNGVFPPFI